MKTIVMLMLAAVVVVGAQAPPQEAPAPSGDAKRGKTLFDQTYRCYACHGFEGETGSPRLVPMARTEEAFMAYVRKPGTAGMPSFSGGHQRPGGCVRLPAVASPHAPAGAEHSAAARCPAADRAAALNDAD